MRTFYYLMSCKEVESIGSLWRQHMRDVVSRRLRDAGATGRIIFRVRRWRNGIELQGIAGEDRAWLGHLIRKYRDGTKP